MDSLITIILLIIGSAVANWIKRKADKDQQQEWTELEDWVNRDAPPRPQSAPPPLEAKPPGEPPRRAGIPPIPTFGGGGTTVNPPPIWRRPEPSRRPAAPPPVVATPRPAPIPTTLVTDEDQTAATLGKLRESRQAYERAAQLHATVTERLRDQGAAQARRKNISRRATDDRAILRRMLQSPHTMRQAILATVILAPPKALQD